MTLYFLLTFSILTILTYSPLLMLLLLIFSTLMSCVMLKINIITSWLSLTLMLVFLGGLLMLLTYITSLTSNFLNFYNTKMSTIIYIMLMLLPLLIIQYWNQKTYYFDAPSFLFMGIKQPMILMFNLKCKNSIYFLMTYLLITLMVIAYILLLKKGPLRKMYN